MRITAKELEAYILHRRQGTYEVSTNHFKITGRNTMSRTLQIRSFRIIFALLLLVGAVSVEGQIFSGRATGINGILTVNGTPTTSIYGDTCPLPNTGGTIVSTTPGSAFNNIFRTGSLTSSTSGAGISSQSSSTVNDLRLNAGGYLVTATTLTADTQCNCCPGAGQGTCGGDSRITGLVITDPSGENFPVIVTGAPNQLITLPNGATITLDERILGTGSLTVNALHLNFTSGTTNTNVVVGSAHSDIDCLTTSPTPADVTVAGRVVTAGGQGILRANVSIINGSGVARSVLTSSTGYYSFTGVEAGQTYVVTASHRLYTFESKTINVTEDMPEVNFTANP